MRTVDPPRWELYSRLRQRGFTMTVAARMSKISFQAAKRYERALEGADVGGSGAYWLRQTGRISA